VGSSEALREKIRQLGVLVGEIDSAPDGPQKTAARALVQLMMEVHGQALERLLEIVFESGPAGEAILAQAGDDAMVRQLLLLYSLHPLALETRVAQALANAEPRLRKVNMAAELVSMHDAAVEIRLTQTGHACGSTGNTARSIIEETIDDLAPDILALKIIGPADKAPGFVPADSLIKVPLARPTLNSGEVAVVSAH
jgi:hypothetical protein